MTDNTTRVLVVDDEQAIRRYLRASLGAHGYELFEASTGREALEMVPIARPDMPIVSGEPIGRRTIRTGMPSLTG